MLKIKNLNSNAFVPVSVDKIISRLSYLVYVSKIPVYLVNKELMDYLYPPEKRRFLNKECVQSLLNDEDQHPFPPYFDDLQDFFETFQRKLSDCKREEISSFTVAVGLYKSSLSDDEIKHIKNTTGFELKKGKTIFICPERVVGWADRSKIDATNLFNGVLFHEMAHAYLDNGTNKYNLPGGRTFEESLCNAISLSLVPDTEDKKAQLINSFMEQPIEYKGFAAFECFIPIIFNFYPFSLRHIEEFFYYLKQYFRYDSQNLFLYPWTINCLIDYWKNYVTNENNELFLRIAEFHILKTVCK